MQLTNKEQEFLLTYQNWLKKNSLGDKNGEERHETIRKIVWICGLAKRIRKYYGNMYIITQNINDFVGSVAIKTQAQAIINNCVYQFVHRLASSDLQDYNNLVSASGRLNKYQKQIISNAPIGTCLFSINNNRMMINIQTSEYEQEAIKN